MPLQTSATGVPKFAPADDFTPFCEAVRAICGVDLLQYKRAQMERRIRTWTARRVRQAPKGRSR
jgi:chemotaxis protein methyltransferase CheR